MDRLGARQHCALDLFCNLRPSVAIVKITNPTNDIRQARLKSNSPRPFQPACSPLVAAVAKKSSGRRAKSAINFLALQYNAKPILRLTDPCRH